jgi:hypothetical protein
MAAPSSSSATWPNGRAATGLVVEKQQRPDLPRGRARAWCSTPTREPCTPWAPNLRRVPPSPSRAGPGRGAPPWTGTSSGEPFPPVRRPNRRRRRPAIANGRHRRRQPSRGTGCGGHSCANLNDKPVAGDRRPRCHRQRRALERGAGSTSPSNWSIPSAWKPWASSPAAWRTTSTHAPHHPVAAWNGSMPPARPARSPHAMLNNIDEATSRAADLTQPLLASRAGANTPSPPWMWPACRRGPELSSPPLAKPNIETKLIWLRSA